jgi:16S rRNA (uracil1498-N3)-methyltransferase
MIRLYHPNDFFPNQILTLNEGQNHYLRHVLRLAIGHRLVVFNEREGEWSAVLTTLSKTLATVMVEEQSRPAITGADISLLFAPIKHDPLTFLMEKATELGVRHFYPVMTERCNITRVNQDRLWSNVRDAAEQCERFDIPIIYPLMSLSKALASWDPHAPLFVCQERGEVPSLAHALRPLSSNAPAGFLIGPEGGFSSQEIAYLRSFSFTQFINLGPRILRAETAAVAAVTCYQAIVGDWEV